MPLLLGRLNKDTGLQEFLTMIGNSFNLLLEVESNDGAVIWRSFSEAETKAHQILSFSLPVRGEALARFNIYHDEPNQKKLAAVETIIKEKLKDYNDMEDLTGELLANYDKLNLYRNLAEQILQTETADASYQIILNGLESVISAEKCGIMSFVAETGMATLIAYRTNGVNCCPSGAKFRIAGTTFDKVASDMKSHLFLSPKPEVLHTNHECGDITLKGPILVAPLVYRREKQNRSVGLLFALEPKTGDFTSIDQHAVSTLSSLASIAMKHYENLETAHRATFEMDTMLKDLMSTFESLQQQTALIEQVNRISTRINSTLDLDIIFNSIADYSRSLLNCESSIVAAAGSGGRISFPGLAGIARDSITRNVIPASESVLSATFTSPKPMICNSFDLERRPLGVSLPLPIRNFTTYPIESKGKIVAVILVFNKKDEETFTYIDSDLLKALSYQATTAIENARLLNDLKVTQFTMMAKLSELAEKRDPETGQHLLRMQKYSRLIARELAKNPKFASQISEQYINEIYAAAPLHDIGKVAIADSILLKRGKLSAEEFDVMKSHAEVGEMILRGPDYLATACEIAGYHHEKYDGSGYPHGSTGSEIPVSARIVAAADVYDALTSRRVYKENMSHEVAMEILEKGRGKHFDPDVLDAMHAAINEIQTIKNLIR